MLVLLSWFNKYNFSLSIPLFSFSITSSFGIPTGEPESECRRYVQVRNITKGDCRLDNVEVSFCRGRCLSRTDVILEVQTCQYMQNLLSAIWLFRWTKECFLHTLEIIQIWIIIVTAILRITEKSFGDMFVWWNKFFRHIRPQIFE